MPSLSRSKSNHKFSRPDQFLLIPFGAAAVIWLIAVAPTAFNTIGLFPSLWLVLGTALISVSALPVLIWIICTVRYRLWRQTASLLAATLAFIVATWACLEYRRDVLVTLSIWRIQAEMIGLTPLEAARFKTNRGVSDGDNTPFVLVVYDGTDADSPAPGKSEKIWISYDWLLTGTIHGCRISSRPLGGHFYLQTVCLKDK